jgi:hypothetical protein
VPIHISKTIPLLKPFNFIGFEGENKYIHFPMMEKIIFVGYVF